jgi:hypothetical protein
VRMLWRPAGPGYYSRLASAALFDHKRCFWRRIGHHPRTEEAVSAYVAATLSTSIWPDARH